MKFLFFKKGIIFFYKSFYYFLFSFFSFKKYFFVTLNKKRLENYDPDKFLFDFSEFKEHFKGLVRMHLVCGEECLHLKRFYKKIGVPNKNRKIYGETIFLNTLRLEEKKNWALNHTEI